MGGVSLRSLQPASRAAAQDRAQPGRALLPALLPPRPLRPPPSLPPFFLLLLFLLLLSGLQPSFLSARPYLWGTFSISLTQGLPASPSAGAGPTPRRGQISKRQRCPRGGASACRAESRRGADVRAPRGRRGGGRTAQGVFLTGGRGSSCRAGRPHPTRRPRRARPGVPARGAAPAARGPSSRRPSSVARPPPRRPAAPPASDAGPRLPRAAAAAGRRGRAGGERTPAGRSANGSPTPAGLRRSPAPGQGPLPAPAPWGAYSGRRRLALAVPGDRAGRGEPVPQAPAGRVTLVYR